MPINIYSDDDSREKIALLCGDNWRLPDQVSELEMWLNENKMMKPGRYIADIGFSIREDARGGGGVISSEMMRIMADLGISVFLSEYPD
jgi:hypothetical protein